MKRFPKPSAFLVLFALLSVQVCLAQKTYTLKSSKVSIHGTSTLHDWTSEVTTVNWSGQLLVEGSSLKSVKSAEVSIPVTSIKSKEGKTMDNKTYDAFKSEQNPNIVFKLKSASVSGKKLLATGDLTMAGTTKSITLNLEAEVSDGEVLVNGSYKLNMKNFNMIPPKAVMGTIKVGPEVTLLIELVLAP